MNISLTFRRKGLLLLALSYLAIPNVLFLAGWVEPIVATFLALVLAAGCWLTVRNLTSQVPCRKSEQADQIALALSLLLLGVWVFLIGAAGQTCQTWDHIVRNPIYETLVRCDWPIFSQSGDYFVYYFAYLLPPALLGRLVGGCATEPSLSWYVILSLWIYIGLALTTFLFYRRFGKHVLLFVVIWMFLGSSGDLLNTLFNSIAFRLEIFLNLHLGSISSWWNLKYALPHGGTVQLFNTYHHAVPVWLIAAVLLEGRLAKRSILFVSALGLLLSPLGSVGIFLLLLVLATADIVRSPSTWKSWLLSPETFAGLCIVAIAAVFYLGGADSSVRFAWQDSPFDSCGSMGKRVSALVLGALCSMGPFLLLFRRRIGSQPLLVAAFAILFLCPLIFVGFMTNELIFKASAIPFLLFSVVLVDCWSRENVRFRVATVLLILIGSFAALRQLTSSCSTVTFDKSGIARNFNTKWQGHLNHPDDVLYRQFFSKKTPFFFLNESGSSSQGLLSWCAAHNRSDQEHLPPAFYPPHTHPGGMEANESDTLQPNKPTCSSNDN